MSSWPVPPQTLRKSGLLMCLRKCLLPIAILCDADSKPTLLSQQDMRQKRDCVQDSQPAECETPIMQQQFVNESTLSGCNNESTELNGSDGTKKLALYANFISVQQIFLHGSECRNADVLLKPSLVNWSAKSVLSFVCGCGWQVSMSSDSTNESYPLDEAISLASAAVPLGYEDIRSLFTILELTPPTRANLESRSRMKIKAQIDVALKKTLKAAGEEERRLAIEADEFVMFKGERVPAIKVVCDGSWSKRSYGHSYNSKYGNAAILGVRTGKVLFVGERMTTCKMCQSNERYNRTIPHACHKNWSGPSTAMEADLIYEGFSKSVEMHGIVYEFFVADGDSSTYARIKDVYQEFTVKKIECINHVIRNLNTKLRNIAGNSVKRRCISKEERSLPRMESRFKRVGLAVQSACRYYKDLGNWETNWKNLREDIKNIPYHIFGRHNSCKSYFQCSLKDKEPDIVEQVKTKPLFLELVDALDRVASLANSLIRRENTAATLSFNNSKFWVGDLFKMNYLKSPCARWKQEKMRSTRFRNKLSKKKPRILSFPFLKAGRGDENYGTDPDRPDLNEEMLKEEMDSIRRAVTVDKERQQEIQISTLGQSNCEIWGRERRKRLTASNAKRICSMQDSTDNHAVLRQLLSQTEFSNEATIYGNTNEPVAADKYAEIKSLSKDAVKMCGLFVSLEHGGLAVSPDRLVEEDGLLEVKCPITASNISIMDWAKERKSQCSLTIKDGTLTMKTEHAHYYQVAMQIFVTERQWCDYFIWSPTGDYFLQRVTRESTSALWDKMKPKLIRFWEHELLPELADSRLERKLKPRIPEYRALAMKVKEDRLSNKHSDGRSSGVGAAIRGGKDTSTTKEAVGPGSDSRVRREEPSAECGGSSKDVPAIGQQPPAP
ncbi:Chromosome-anchoring protein RacA [Orchesella cincta]|uniref:Chromosome-anchoring protein RacA n=1 Tax=Orchesella cincta TaxID=48709 RepID=A0A1D2MES9_ORCCI|nr:Chromosome-anchoring protein RacA [Orchesella cincta]